MQTVTITTAGTTNSTDLEGDQITQPAVYRVIQNHATEDGLIRTTEQLMEVIATSVAEGDVSATIRRLIDRLGVTVDFN